MNRILLLTFFFLLTLVIASTETLSASDTPLCFLDDSEDAIEREISWKNSAPDRFQENWAGEFAAHWISRPAVELWSCPKTIEGRPASAIGRKASFGRRYFISDRATYHDQENVRWVLLSDQEDLMSNRPTHRGWVKESDLLLWDSPLANPQTQISYKALINSSPQIGSIKIPLRYAPSFQSPKTGDLFLKRTFHIFDVFDPQHPRQNIENKLHLLKTWQTSLQTDRNYQAVEAELRAGLLKNVFLLLGDTSRLDTSAKKLGGGLLGWVPAKYVRLWNTREALEFSGEINVYRNDDKRQIKTTFIKKQPYSYMAPRHPVLQSNDAGSYRIGLFSPISAERLKGHLSDITIPLDVMFVIDATRSMEPAFKASKNAVQTMVRELNESARRQHIPAPFFGLFVYRDKPEQNRASEICNRIRRKGIAHQLVPLQPWQTQGPFENELDSLVASDCDADFLEAVYEGLYQSVKSATFKSKNNEKINGYRNKSYRALIHIGDHGDNGRSISLEQVSELFRKQRINYFPIHVSSMEGSQNAYQKSFAQSISGLSRNVSKTRDSKYYASLNSNDISRNIIAALRTASASQTKQLAEIRRVEKRLEAASPNKGIIGQGDWPTVKLDEKWNWENDISPQVLDFIHRQGVSFDGELEVYHEGWVRPQESKNGSITKVVLVQYSKLLSLSTILNSLIDARTTPRNLSRTWGRILSQLTGDQPCEVSVRLSQCLKQVEGVHFNLGLLQYSLEELSSILQKNRRRFAHLMCEAKGKSTIIKGLLEEKAYDVDFGIKDGNCVVKSDHTGKKPVWFKAGENQMAWIPIHSLP